MRCQPTSVVALMQQAAILLVCLAAATAFATQRERQVSELEVTATTTP